MPERGCRVMHAVEPRRGGGRTSQRRLPDAAAGSAVATARATERTRDVTAAHAAVGASMWLAPPVAAWKSARFCSACSVRARSALTASANAVSAASMLRSSTCVS